MVYPGGLRKPNHNPHTESISCGLPLLAGLLPRIILTSDFGHASRAKGGWPDPARVIRTHCAPGRFLSGKLFQAAGRDSAGGLDRIAQPLHGELDIFRLQVTPALDLRPVPFFRKAPKI